MKTVELFRKILLKKLEEMPRGAQSELADRLNIDRGHLNHYVRGRKILSEDKREQLAELLGYSYIDFLLLGEEMFPEEFGKSEGEVVRAEKLDRALLTEVIEQVEIRFDEYEIELPPQKKAEFILLLYDHFFELGKSQPISPEKSEETIQRFLRLVA